MRKSVHLWMALVALGIVFGCAGVSFGQDDDKPPIVGGYSKVATNNPAVEAAAEFAVSEQKRKQGGPLSLTEIKRAERQVVAGTNYRLCLNVKAGDEDDAGVEAWDVEAVVFEKLPRAPGNKYKLTSWVKKDCGGSDSEGNHATAPR
ncbi:MAG TPA: cystatin domain-containing protein [Pyrinomonadaceae bacterium]|nr:cystatin domain-containing protein [Pyrinomonadaceae bacterium]